MGELVELVGRSLAETTREEFEARVREQAANLIEEIEAGQFDSPSFAVGLELEVYAADDEGRLATLPDGVFEETCNKELGCHNAELNTPPSRFDTAGMAEQTDAIEQAVAAARDVAREEGLELALDGMWTIPPAEGTPAYLSAVEAVDDVSIASNMQRNARYWALDNSVLASRSGRIELDLPGYSGAYPTILPESLTSSIQPHLQVPTAAEFPRYYNIALRTMAPILAMATNSPFLPADLYEAGADPEELLADGYHELRIPVFEQSVNAGAEKVRFPRDIDRATDIVTRNEADATRAPFLREWVESDPPAGLRDRIWEFDHKRGTYWRWLRGIAGGQPVGDGTERSLRLEYRPIPTQPTVVDTIGLQWLTVGLIRGLVGADHPLCTLDWAASRSSFYAAVEDGLEADLAWVDRHGNRTDDSAVVYEEVFEFARRGLAAAGVDDSEIERYLEPIEARWESRRTPSSWKRARVRSEVDAGTPIEEAIQRMQRDYLARSRSGRPFVEWA